MRTKLVVLLTAVALVTGGYVIGQAGTRRGGDDSTSLPGFSQVVSLSHVNAPARTPLFPGDPAFTLTTVATVEDDGFYMQYVREGEHTGTHYSAPCHFRDGKPCAEDLDAADYVLPAVVVDVRDAGGGRCEPRRQEDRPAGLGDRARRDASGCRGAAVDRMRMRSGDRRSRKDERTYYNCGQRERSTANRASRRARCAG